MNTKIILIAGLLLISAACGSVVAATDVYNYGIFTSDSSYITYAWKNITIDAKVSAALNMRYVGQAGGVDTDWIKPYIKWYDSSIPIFNKFYGNKAYWQGTGMNSYSQVYNTTIGIIEKDDTISISSDDSGDPDMVPQLIRFTVYFYDSNADIFTISGYVCGIENVTLEIKDGTNYYPMNNTTFNESILSYSFPIVNNTQYKLNFSDGYEYEFTVDGSDITYNYDLCSYITLNFKDNCGNLLRETEFQYCNHLECITCYFENTSSGSYDIFFEDQDYLELWVNSAAETLYYNISNPQNNSIITYTILNPTISWNNNIYVIDGNTSLLIENALVMFSQDCIIMPTLYPSRNKFTNTSGLVNFEQCELDSFSLGISATNYKSFSDNNISSDNLSAFLLEQTIVVKLYPSTDENESEYDYTDYGTWINFKNVNGNYTTAILDTDNYVDLYYYNNNTGDVSMTLKFQKYSVSTGFTTLLSWNIPKDTSGYKRILKSNYTDTLSSYRGYLYNYTINGWDRIKYLTVRNETDEIDLDYQNLTSYTWFVNKNVEGSIDYREDINIIAYANTSYVGLFIISLELYDNSEYVEHTNLTWADFTTADLKYYYEWNPSHSYINGHNYTVRMHGYDYYLLDMDYVNATDYRKNKLTIIVKNQFGTDLSNAFIYLEDYGSLSTGINNYNSYENLDNGYYRFKATKPDYIGTGWSDITISDSDEIVTYVLTAIDSDAGTATQPQKMDENELQNIYLIIMAFLFIFVIIGGLKYALQ